MKPFSALKSIQGIKLLAIGCLLLGIFFRFYHLDYKVYWIDETYTSLRISGHTEQELVENLYNGQVFPASQLSQYQQPNPDRSIQDTLTSLQDSPQHPPAYFLLGRVWEQWLGHSISSLRLLSAILSLLTFPALFWLCWELFGAAEVGWMAIALFAVSPFHVLYAQEARQYSLWIALTLFSSAALLRALRHTELERSTKSMWWGIYALMTAASFYTFLLSGLVAIAHFIFLVLSYLTHQIKRHVDGWMGYCKAITLATVLFSPWIWVLYENLNRVTGTASWTNQRFSLDWLLLRWILYPINLFFDLDLGDRYLTSPALIIMIAFAGLIGYCLWIFLRCAPRSAVYFLCSLLLIPALSLAIPDLVLGGQRSATARYMIPAYLGIQIAIAYTFHHKIYASVAGNSKVWRSITAIVLSLSILSCGISANARLWWTKSPDKHLHQDRIANIVNQAPHALLISDDSTLLSDCFACRILSLGYDLNPQVQLQLVRAPEIPAIPTEFQSIWVFSPAKALVRGIRRRSQHGYELLFSEDNFWFWQILPPESE